MIPDVISVEDVEDIEAWIVSNFGSDGLDTRSAMTVTAGTTEELGELMRALVKMEQGIRGTAEEWQAEAAKELGDVFIKLVDIASWYGLDFIDAIQKRWATVSQRNWVKDTVGHGIPKEDA
jgi:NTP pyrophosphatase (non-canonical NTP hydrolase)